MSDPVVRYDPSLLLGVPVIASRDQYEDFAERFETSAPLEFAEYVKSCGCLPPTTDFGWVVGRQPTGRPGQPDRLVWYQPAKLKRIHVMVEQVIRDHPDIEELVVTQGHGWDDLGIVPVAARPPGGGAPTLVFPAVTVDAGE